MFFRCAVVRRAWDHGDQLRGRIRVLQGGFRRRAGLPVLVGVDPGAEAFSDGNHLPKFRSVRGRSFHLRMRPGRPGDQAGVGSHIV